MKIIPFLQRKKGMSRRNITKMIDNGEILVNNQPVQSYKQELTVGDILTLSGNQIIVDNTNNDAKRMLLFNKPEGYVVSKSDPHNTHIYDILPPKYKDWYYIGRLDKNTSGLLLLTNDSHTVNRYEHPKFDVEKEYLVTVKNYLSVSDFQRIRNGISDADDVLPVISISEYEGSTYRIVLNQGKKRHIRRIFRELKNPVLQLKRIREGDYILGNLAVGDWKEVNI